MYVYLHGSWNDAATRRELADDQGAYLSPTAACTRQHVLEGHKTQAVADARIAIHVTHGEQGASSRKRHLFLKEEYAAGKLAVDFLGCCRDLLWLFFFVV